MYAPKLFRETDREAMLDLIRQQSFALFITTDERGLPVATHIPIELHTAADGTERLVAHLAKANPQTKQIGSDVSALAVFSGPHAYISSSWYDHVNVPTWNYLSVHVYGRTHALTDEETLGFLRRQVDKYEAASAHPVSVESMTEAYVRKEMRGLVAFEMTIETLEGAAKLSQNRDDKNHAAIVDHLRQRTDADSQAVADAMSQQRRNLCQ